MATPVSWNDIRFCSTNNSRTVSVTAGNSITITDARAAFFIVATECSDLIVKDESGNVVKDIEGPFEMNLPGLRVDYQMTLINNSGSDNDVNFYKVPIAR